MKVKHQSEWPQIIDVARKCKLEYDQIILLLAIREVEDGIDGHEFQQLCALGNGLIPQATACAKEIKHQELYYQSVLRKDPDNVQDFIEYFYRTDTDKIDITKKHVGIIRKIFTDKEPK